MSTRDNPSAHPSGGHDRPYEAIIIGAGFGGLGMAIALRKAGIRHFLILEKGVDVGGVWRDNAYPGAACDVPSHLYSFSFEPNPRWTRVFAPQAEILAYLQHCARKFELLPHFQPGSEVTLARYDEQTCLWHVSLADSRTLVCRTLISATGQLSRPAVPKLEGIDTFGGASFHSAQWNHTVPLDGQRVAVIGTGASAVQFVPAIAPRVATLQVFQRSPAHLMPRPDRAYSKLERALFRWVPGVAALYRASIYVRYESRALAFTRFKGLMKIAVGRPFRRMLDAQVRDARLREQLTPTYPIGCKRILLSSEYLASLARPNVHVRTTGIRRVRPDGIETTDGRVHEADVIIFGTGFAATEFLSPMRIVGKGGLDLNTAWRDGASAYLGISVSGFPNFFMLYGPNTNLGHNSIVYMIESQIDHVMRCWRAAQARGATSIEVTQDRHHAYAHEMRASLRKTVWSGCTSWYTDANGNNTTNWPGFTFTYRWRAQRNAVSAYRFERSRSPAPGAMVLPPTGLQEALRAATLRTVLRGVFRTFVGPPFGPVIQRSVVALLSPWMPGTRGVLRYRDNFGGVPTEVVAPERGDSGWCVLYLHGGAFCLGSPRTHRSITSHLAREGALTVFAPDYRLSPEHPHPAALDDALACYNALLGQGFSAQRIVLAGDSAGGTLALSMAMTLKRLQQPMPAALLMVAPLVDTTLATARTSAKTVRDPMLRLGWLSQGVAWQAGEPSAPTAQELAGLPPMLVQVGTDDMLLGDAELLVDRARAAGVSCELQVYESRWHVFHLQAAYLDSAKAALQSLVAFAQRHVPPPGAGQSAAVDVHLAAEPAEVSPS